MHAARCHSVRNMIIWSSNSNSSSMMISGSTRWRRMRGAEWRGHCVLVLLSNEISYRPKPATLRRGGNYRYAISGVHRVWSNGSVGMVSVDRPLFYRVVCTITMSCYISGAQHSGCEHYAFALCVRTLVHHLVDGLAWTHYADL